MSKNAIANLLYLVAFLLAISPYFISQHVKNEELTRKYHFVQTHPCQLVPDSSRKTYFDWQSDSVKVFTEAKKFQCRGVDGFIVLREDN